MENSKSVGAINMVIGATSSVSCVVLFDFLCKYTTDIPLKRTIDVTAYNFN